MAISTDLTSRRSAIRLLGVTVALNAAVFVGLRLCAAFVPAAITTAIDSLAVSPDAWLERPWTFVTYMFTQYDELHIILNMLWLAWFWLLMAEAGIPARSIAATYISGGLSAAVVYAALAPGGMLVGSSGAVMAVVAATAVAIPRRRIDLPLLRPVSVVVAAGVIIAISAVCMAYGSPWSHAAHLAGIGTGAIAGAVIRSRRKAGLLVTTPSGCDSRPIPASLLEKLRTSGYDSLSDAERLMLINGSLRKTSTEQSLK